MIGRWFANWIIRVVERDRKCRARLVNALGMPTVNPEAAQVVREALADRLSNRSFRKFIADRERPR